MAEGPLGNAIDAASDAGNVAVAGRGLVFLEPQRDTKTQKGVIA